MGIIIKILFIFFNLFKHIIKTKFYQLNIITIKIIILNIIINK